MDKIQLKAGARNNKTNLGKLRKSGQVPAVLYGHNVKNQNLSINLVDFEKALKKAGESTIIDLLTDDGQQHPVLIYDVQNHYLTNRPFHVDFYQVSMTEKLKTKVALEFVGEAPAVKTLGGVLVKTLGEVEVECLPADLPHSLIVDISILAAFQDSISIKDIKVPPKVKILTTAEEIVVKVQPPRDVEAELAQPAVEDISKVEGAAEQKPAADSAAPAEGKEAKAEKAEEKKV